MLPLQQRHTLRPDHQIHGVENDAEEQVQNQDHDKRIDEGVGRGPADPFGPRIAMEAAMATDDGDRSLPITW